MAWKNYGGRSTMEWKNYEAGGMTEVEELRSWLNYLSGEIMDVISLNTQAS
jgi:hypothetical protein